MTTMHQELLELLKREWVTPIDALNKVQCFSLSQRAGDLRRNGVNVVDKWVPLPNGKRIKAYRVLA